MTRYPHPVPPELLEFLTRHRSFWLATHERPDADGYGSLLACGLALQQRGKEVAVLVDDEIPAHFDALPGHSTLPRVDDDTPAPDAVLVFDCHALHRMGETASRIPDGVAMAMLDHHPLRDGGCEAEVCWVIPTAAATSIVVQSLLEALDDPGPTPDQATCLYAALVTDTGGFRYDNTRSDTLLAASRLVKAGADAANITEVFLHQRRPESLHLLARVFDRVIYSPDGRIAVASIPRALLREAGVPRSETEGIVSFLTSVVGVELVALAIEQEDGAWRVSLRANPPHRVSKMAKEMGGGGHARAAAFVSDLPLERLRRRLLDCFEEVLAESDAAYRGPAAARDEVGE